MKNSLEQIKEHLIVDLNTIDVIDTHEHARIGYEGPDYHEEDPIRFLLRHYIDIDIEASGILNKEEYSCLFNSAIPVYARWPLFEKAWRYISSTAYAKVVKYVLQDICNTENPSLDVLEQLENYLAVRKQQMSVAKLKEAGIRCIICDYLFPPNTQRPLRYFENTPFAEFLGVDHTSEKFFRPTFNLQYFHELRHWEFIHFVEELSGFSITTLHDYEDAVFDLMKRGINNGIIGIKDQSAYRRTLDYTVTPYAEAERLFVKLLADPRNQLAWPEAKSLDDYLFHLFMAYAKKFDLPVQIHTGHVANIRNRVGKANAEKFTGVLELHRGVKFDLFHGNWPYMGDILFLVKNYPNAHLNLCWVHMIDPEYAIELIRRAVKVIPNNKLHAFGGDFWDAPEFTLAHLRLAKENFCSALAALVYEGWLDYDEAVLLANYSFYENPKNFYHLT